MAWLLPLALLACKQPGEASKGPPAAAAEPYRGLTIHFSKLVPFAPDSLLGYQGGKTAASTSRFGDVAVSEIERGYTDGERHLKLRIVDTNINRGAKARPGEAFEDSEKLGKPLLTASAVGYVEYEKMSGRAQADLVVADRILVTVTCENGGGTEAVERFSAALDLHALAQVAREEPPHP